ncbi:MAG: alkaline phosphatase PhoX [Verrucomicrobiota bacterium]
MHSNRREFLKYASTVSAGFLGLERMFAQGSPTASPYGPLIDGEVLQLPKGFRCQVLSQFGDVMDDGYKTPGKLDGMAAFEAPDGRVVLIRNQELALSMAKQGPFADNSKLPDGFDPADCYDPGEGDEAPMVGGTTNLVYNEETEKLDAHFLSLVGTDRNCAGGPTPWGTWITCEESEAKFMPTKRGQKHGYNFEVKPTVEPGIQRPKPLKQMGRMRHEAVAVDPATSIVYETEDISDGLIYRFIPDKPKDLSNGKLQALVIRGKEGVDTTTGIPVGQPMDVDWVDMEDPESPNDDLRKQGRKKGAAAFARGEGMWYGEDAIYFVCTTGGKNRGGQIWRYLLKTNQVELYLEPNDNDLLQNGDNITVAPFGDLYICEDAKKQNNMIRGVTTDGEFYTLAANVYNYSELAGVCFSPSGRTMFVNIQNPGLTLAITGPWSGS